MVRLESLPRIFLGATLVGISMIYSKAEAQPPGRYALTCLINPTNLPINYYYRWGNDEWQTDTISVGNTAWHSWEYSPDNPNVSPNFDVQYDSDLTDRVALREHPLDRYSSPSIGQPGDCPEYGKEYEFFVRPDGQLDLRSLD